MKKKIGLLMLISVIGAVFVFGLILVLIPIVQKANMESNLSHALEGYFERKEDPSSAQKNPALRKAMERYNQKLAEGGQKRFTSPADYEIPTFHLADYGEPEECFGTISIPKIGIQLALYNGANDDTMMLGAGVFANTSLPIGGDSTNTVVAAHNRYNNVNIFLEIDTLQKGDPIYVENFWETLCYRVKETDVISPDDFQHFYIEPGENLLTLMTCYQFPNNDQRYVVVAEYCAEP
ncbi:MAG: class C sortase [Oscillospiraceae bacterium]|nr:class C sortase [Oscillospiraceae bacterium]